MFLLEGGAHVSEVQPPSVRAEGSPPPRALPLQERGCGENGLEGAGMLAAPGLLSVCLAWPCTQQRLIHYTRPQGLVPWRPHALEGFPAKREGLRSEPVGTSGATLR